MTKILKKALRIILAAAVLVFALTAADIWYYASFDQKQKADAVIVLGAGSWDSRVSPVFRERLNHGIDLYTEGYAGKIILTGGYAAGNNESDAHAAMIYCISQGVPQDDLILEEKSSNTEENIRNAKAIMDGRGMASAIIVSDPLHMRRAMLFAQADGMTAYSSPTPTSRYVTLRTQLPFFLREELYCIGYRCARVFGASSMARIRFMAFRAGVIR